jgi:EAL domain-containing protein (putative c-di-GMP-specific phosphodiesterase class I)
LPPGTRRAAEVRGRTGRKSSGERRIALDDSGACHYSLRRLPILLVDIVKIDGSLVGNLTRRPLTRIFLAICLV